ncbi:MAG: radical SAM protein [Anaerolineae bacterium]
MRDTNSLPTPQPIKLIYPDNAPQAFHLLAKPTGAICNLDCAYCFFLDKELLYPGSHFRMRDEVLEQYIRQLIEAHQTNHVNIAWQGGEPTIMGLDFYRKAMDLAEKYRRPGMTFLNTMQTNGTLLDDEWGEFFKEHNFLIGISIDGPRERHDFYRVDTGGTPTVDKVMRGLRLLQKHGVEYNILTTVNRVNADYPLEVYRFLRDEAGTDWMQFIPVVERINADGRTLYQEGTTVSERSVLPEQFGRFLMVASPGQQKFGQDKRDTLPKYCLDCDVRFACHGECPKNRFIETPDGEPGLNYLCVGFKHFFHHIDYPAGIMADLIRQARPAAEVMGILTQEEARWAALFARAGRNDPCPCGSGRKFKYCHGGRPSNGSVTIPGRPAPAA